MLRRAFEQFLAIGIYGYHIVLLHALFSKNLVGNLALYAINQMAALGVEIQRIHTLVVPVLAVVG